MHNIFANYYRAGVEKARIIYTQWLVDCNSAAASGSAPLARPLEADWTDRIPANQDIFDKWNKICQDRHMLLFPFTNNFIILFFIIQSELSNGQREWLTIELQSNGILNIIYDLGIIKQKYYDFFIISRTTIQDLNIRPSFWIVDQGEYEGEEGLWVEDE